MYKEKLKEIPEIKPEKTVAEGIRIAEPVRAEQILGILDETGGDVFTVSENEIKDALSELYKSGLFVEPTSAAAPAALKKYNSIVDEKIVIPLTGSGLKALDKIAENKGSPHSAGHES
ncbi:pyridoxal-phosphate dependent enzyme [candidate division KSB1 bacterium]